MSLKTDKIPREAQVTRPVVAKTDNKTTNNRYLERVKKLEDLLAKQIERSVELLVESQGLEAELEKMKQQRDCWRKLYKKIRPDKKVSCDRQNAMVEYGDVDMSEVLGSK